MIPIHIVTGFLGSGKTTFIKKLLTAGDNQNTLVLINELGEVGIDNHLVENIAQNTYLLPNGCICCAVLTDLKETLLSVLSKRNAGEIPHFGRVLIETTGLANPASILSTLYNDIHIQGQFMIHGLTTIVDAENAELQNRLNPEWLTQVVAAQQILLSKTDRVDEPNIKSLTIFLSQLNNEAEITESIEVSSLDELFLKKLKFIKPDSMRFFYRQEKQLHQQTQSTVIELDCAIDWMVFGIWINLLLTQYGENILRVKGILNLQDFDQPVLIDGVQHCLYPPEHLDHWPWDDHCSRIVFIVRNLDVNLLQKSFQTIMKLK